MIVKLLYCKYYTVHRFLLVKINLTVKLAYNWRNVMFLQLFYITLVSERKNNLNK